ncbi:MAG: serine/threonine-protein kinase [Acidimicrobiales bacterium]
MQLRSSSSAMGTGTVIADRYRLGQLLGSGGMAFVYDAVDLRLQRLVAVKLLRPEMVVRDEIRTRFEVEARAAAGLSHPNAVAVFDTGEYEGVPYLVMERLPGETLADRLAAGPVEAEWMRQVAGQTLAALGAAHKAGIVHRDVKPGNILLAADGTAKISDFGIAKSVQSDEVDPNGRPSDLTGTGQLLGTPAYLAPERLDGHPATARSDLFALGVVLYEALSGQKPFLGDTPLAVARAVSEGDHAPLGMLRPDLDPVMVATVERALARDPEDRFATAEDMAAALAQTSTGGPVVDPTVDIPANSTMVLPVETLRPGTPLAARRAIPDLSPGARKLVWLGVAALAVLLLLLLVRADRSSDPQVATQGATTSAPPSTAAALTPAQAQAEQVRDLASRLDPSTHGPRASALADGLNRVADQLEAGNGGPEATALLVAAAQWLQSGQLTTQAAVSAFEILQQVPGVGQVSVSGPGEASTPQADSPAPRNGDGDGKGKAKGKDDDD